MSDPTPPWQTPGQTPGQPSGAPPPAAPAPGPWQAPAPGQPAYPPGGYAYPPPPAPVHNDGLAIAGFVLSLVGLIPCFWLFQVPALLGVIFGFVGRSRIAASRGQLRGAGMALAAIIVGAVLVALCVLFWVLVLTDADTCVDFGGNFCDEPR